MSKGLAYLGHFNKTWQTAEFVPLSSRDCPAPCCDNAEEATLFSRETWLLHPPQQKMAGWKAGCLGELWFVQCVCHCVCLHHLTLPRQRLYPWATPSTLRNLLYLFKLYLLLLHAHIWVCTMCMYKCGHMCAVVRVWRSENDFWEFVLFFHFWLWGLSPGHQVCTQELWAAEPLTCPEASLIIPSIRGTCML